MKKAELERMKKDYVAALRIIHHQGLSDAFAHLSARIDGSPKMLFMPRKSPALVKPKDLFVVGFETPVSQSGVHQALYKARQDIKAVIHFHSPYTILLSVVGQKIRPMHNYSVIFYDGVPVYEAAGQVETPERAAEIAQTLGSGKAVILRGHGAVVVGHSIPEVCMLALYLEESARFQFEALKVGEPHYIRLDEAERIAKRTFKPASTDRAWDHYRSMIKI